jgi:hypothetical protein
VNRWVRGRCPSVVLLAAQLLLTGIAYGTSSAASASEPAVAGVGALLAAGVCGSVVAVLMHEKLSASRSFTTYPAEAVAKAVPWAVGMAGAVGQWQPAGMRLQFGSVYSGYRGGCETWRGLGLGLGRSVVLGAVAGLRVASEHCHRQVYAMAGLSAAFAVGLAVLSPRRVRVANGAGALSGIVSAGILVAAASGAADEGGIDGLMTAATLVSMLGLAGGAVNRFYTEKQIAAIVMGLQRPPQSGTQGLAIDTESIQLHPLMPSYTRANSVPGPAAPRRSLSHGSSSGSCDGVEAAPLGKPLLAAVPALDRPTTKSVAPPPPPPPPGWGPTERRANPLAAPPARRER